MVFFGEKAVFTVVEVFAVFAFEPRTYERIHLAAIAVDTFMAGGNNLKQKQ